SVINNSHSHSNMSTLNNLTSSVINNSHSHSNKSYLDSINQNLSKGSHPEFDLLTIRGKLDMRTYSEQYGISICSYGDDEFYYLYRPGNYWHRFRNSDFEDICVFRGSKECYFYGYSLEDIVMVLQKDIRKIFKVLIMKYSKKY